MLKGLADRFTEGGWPMWLILITLVVSVAIIIERAVYLIKAGIDKDQLLALLKSQIMAGNVQGAIKACSGNPAPMTHIILAGLTKFNRPDHEVQAAMDESALRELPLIERRTGYLALLGNVATLIGLFGTVTGLIDCFKSVAGADASTKATLLARGISEAMNCTWFGLITAIVALLCFAALNGRTQKLLDDINEVSVQVVNLVVGHRNAMKGSQAA